MKLKIVKSILGEPLFESLNKALVKLNTKSVIDLAELHSAIKTVPKSIIAFLVKELKDMEKDHTKEVKIPWDDTAMMTVTKMDADVYKGKIIKDSKVVHEFDLTAIPQLAAHIMSCFEVYEEEEHQQAAPVAAPQSNETEELRNQIKALDHKINSLMMMVINQPIAKSDKIKGGLADKKKVSDFDPEKIKEGIKVEMEHTDDSKIAQEIAMDHLSEDPDYYIKLKTIEKSEDIVKSSAKKKFIDSIKSYGLKKLA